MALGLSPCRCSSMIMTSSPSRTTESLPPARGAASANAGLGPVRASPDRPQTRNEVGNIRGPLLGRIHRPPRDMIEPGGERAIGGIEGGQDRLAAVLGHAP